MLIDLVKWYEMNISERTTFLQNGGELDDLSRQVLLICDDLVRCGAIIPEKTKLKYYMKRKQFSYYKNEDTISG